MPWNPTQAVLTGSPLDRAAHLRDDAAALERMKADPAARMLIFNTESKPMLRVLEQGVALAWRAVEPGADPVFLGLEDGAPRFAMITDEAAPDGDAKFIDLRSVTLTGDLSDPEAATASQAKAMTGWHASHLRCARCGAETAMGSGGWKRVCGACDAQHFPRTDPVVIMLVQHGDRIAIANNVRFPGNLYSLIAGFVEPGETIEEAARRETFEELGLRSGRVRYISSQPWPFPATLMFGCAVEALDDAFTLEEAEIADARWLDREALAQLFAGEAPDMMAPRRDAIAATLLRDWLEGRVGFGV